MILAFSIVEQLFLICVAISILVIPGAVWVLWFKKNPRDLLENLADTIGISISIIALLGMIFFYLGISVNQTMLNLFLAGIIIALITALIVKKRKYFQIAKIRWQIIFFVLLMAIIGWRFYQASSLVLPAWVDSVHHVLVTQKILDNGGVPARLGPELDVPFFYHYGFHITAALFSALSKLPADQTVLWLGQVLNAMLSLGIYRLVKSTWQDVRKAGLAALLVGFAFQMPAYYLTWGRYTLLTGLLIMLMAMAAGYELIFRKANLESVLRMALLTAGLALTHYMALFFLALFLLAAGLVRLIPWVVYKLKKDLNEPPDSLQGLWSAAGASLLGVLISSPWLVRMLSALSAQARVSIVLPGSDQAGSFQYILYLIGPRYNHILMGIAALGLLLAWARYRSMPIAVWATILVLLALPWGLRLGPFRPDHMAIVLFVPAAALLSNLVISSGDWLGQKTKKWIGAVFWVVLSLAGLAWGSWHTRSILNPVTILADQTDKTALNWIDRNLPEDARFFANTAHWQFGAYRGVDGAYWLLPETGRFSIALPALYSYGTRDQVDRWRSWMIQASQINTCDDSFWNLVKEADLTNIYLHKGRGSLQPDALQDCPGVRILYQYANVFIYQIDDIP